MRQALLFISLRSWRNHKLRIAITILSVCVAVSAFVALQAVNQSLKHSLEATVDNLAGKATLQITAGQAGIPEAALDTVRSTPGVTDAPGVLQIFCRTSEDFLRWRDLLIFGIDAESFLKLRPSSATGSLGAPFNPLAFLQLPGAIVISSTIARERALSVGQTLAVYTPPDKVDLTILAVFDDQSLSNLYGGRGGIKDISAAQTPVHAGKAVTRL